MNDTTRRPGATTSGLAYASYQVGPRELNGATTSSERVTVFFVSTAPTVMADGALAGDGCHHNDDTRGDRPFNRPNQRIGRCWLVNRVSERQIDDVDLQLRFAGNREIERGKHRARRAGAVRTEHFHANQPCAARDAAISRIRLVVLAANDASDVCAVAVVVELLDLGAAVEEIVEGDHRELVVVDDSRIEHRDADVLAGAG
jgi:hypothetical protein